MQHVSPLAALAGMAALAACASSDSLLVDRRGVDDARYNRELSECKQMSPPSLLPTGNPVATCMTAKGYKVLMGR